MQFDHIQVAPGVDRAGDEAGAVQRTHEVDAEAVGEVDVEARVGGAALPVFRLALLVEHGPAEFVDGFRLNDLFADLVDGAAAPHGRDFAGGDEQVRTAGIHRILKQVDQIHEISFPGIR